MENPNFKLEDMPDMSVVIQQEIDDNLGSAYLQNAISRILAITENGRQGYEAEFHQITSTELPGQSHAL